MNSSSSRSSFSPSRSLFARAVVAATSAVAYPVLGCLVVAGLTFVSVDVLAESAPAPPKCSSTCTTENAVCTECGTSACACATGLCRDDDAGSGLDPYVSGMGCRAVTECSLIVGNSTSEKCKGKGANSLCEPPKGFEDYEAKCQPAACATKNGDMFEQDSVLVCVVTSGPDAKAPSSSGTSGSSGASSGASSGSSGASDAGAASPADGDSGCSISVGHASTSESFAFLAPTSLALALVLRARRRKGSLDKMNRNNKS